MEETQNNNRLLDVIAILSSQDESGQLEIRAGTTLGAFFFRKGKLVAARMGTLSGFQAVNAAVSIRDATFSFDSSTPPPPSSFNSPSERIVLKRLFGIETVDPTVANDQVSLTGVEPAFTRSREEALSDPKWSASGPQNADDKHAQDEENLGESDLKKLAEASDLAKRKETVEAPRMADEIHELIEIEARKNLEEKEGRSIAQQQKLDQLTSLEVTAETANETQSDSDEKLCPICNRSYSDDSLNYCLDDGAVLLAAHDSEATLVRRNPPSFNLRRNLASPLSESWKSSSQRGLYLAILLALMGVGAVAFVQKWSERRLTTSSAKPSESSLPLATQVSEQSEPTSSEVRNLSGQWRVTNTIKKTSYRAFANLEIGFRLRINQIGKDFTAEGEKVSENGRLLPATHRTPIHLTGSVDGEKVEATFVEEGVRRKTSGRFVWRIENAGLIGGFVSTAAKTTGTSAATKEL